MRSKICVYSIVFFLCCSGKSISQIKDLKLVLKASDFNWANINALIQDKQGYIWIATKTKGLERFDGLDLKEYLHEENDQSSISGNWIQTLCLDSTKFIWVGTHGFGLNQLDISTNKFVRFRHHPDDPSSLSNDTVTAILKDHLGNLWIGSFSGLDLYNRSTGKFTHYTNVPGDTASLSHNHVRAIYEDRQGTIWVGTGSPYYMFDNELREDGGLNRFNPATKQFKRYVHTPNVPGTISNNKVVSIFEDTKNNLWVGTAGDGLQILDRSNNLFTHFIYDSLQPGKLSRPPWNKNYQSDHVAFIKEDAKNQIWIGTYAGGMNCYNPATKLLTYYPVNAAMAAISTNDSLFWIAADGNLYATNFIESRIPHFPDKHNGVNAILFDEHTNALWLGTNKGLVAENKTTNIQTTFIHDSRNPTSISNDTINAICVGQKGFLWLATYGGGVVKFDTHSNTAVAYRHNSKNTNSIASDLINSVYLDQNENLWIATADAGVDELNTTTNAVVHFNYNTSPSNRVLSNFNICMTQDKNGNIWIGSDDGLTKIYVSTGKIQNYYLANSFITGLCLDAQGKVWAGGYDGIYHFTSDTDQLVRYKNQNSKIRIGQVISMLQGNHNDIWVSTTKNIIRVNTKSNDIRVYDNTNGITENTMSQTFNYKSYDGRLYFGDQAGYYSFYSDRIMDNSAPHLLLSAFYVGEKEINQENSEILKEPLWLTKQINLKYDQNNFSFDFPALDYKTPNDKTYLFMLENYENNWLNTGGEHRAYFYKVPAGNYIFHAKSISANGIVSEKSISVIVSPPWWKTVPAYIFYGIAFLILIFFANRIVRTRIIEQEKIKEREKELLHAKEIEKAYNELRLTQDQLIQSEKMASLGQLTAGIAHEIQNPLNFVNNFSEVNKELLDEALEENQKGNISEVELIINDIKSNEDKINHHGKRADAIVKGMLQHSRSTTGIKEPTDINALADEYLRLAYHGLRGKDKSFNVTITTNFGDTVGKINVIQQDIGRVLLNLYNNAFYAVNEKTKFVAGQPAENNYQPTVSVTTSRNSDKVEIRVWDNGNGVPEKLKDKIFQPFFTTKPTGQGTGLGLSISYDIVKAHGGEIRLSSVETEFTQFAIILSV